MSRISFVNGIYCDYKSASVHIEDRGYQFADGVYEVFAVINSKLIDYDGHINRLYKSLKEIKLNSPLAKESYLFHIKNLVKNNKKIFLLALNINLNLLIFLMTMQH